MNIWNSKSTGNLSKIKNMSNKPNDQEIISQNTDDDFNLKNDETIAILTKKLNEANEIINKKDSELSISNSKLVDLMYYKEIVDKRYEETMKSNLIDIKKCLEDISTPENIKETTIQFVESCTKNLSFSKVINGSNNEQVDAIEIIKGILEFAKTRIEAEEKKTKEIKEKYSKVNKKIHESNNNLLNSINNSKYGSSSGSITSTTTPEQKSSIVEIASNKQTETGIKSNGEILSRIFRNWDGKVINSNVGKSKISSLI
jgi:hypothetical protein